MKELDVLTPESLASQLCPNETVTQVLGPERRDCIRGLFMGATP